jgi:hypothetical protein
MKLLFVSLIGCAFILLGCQNNQDSQKTTEISLKDSIKTDVYNFPEDWKGKWKGELEIWSVDSIIQKVPMQLIIEGDSLLSWNIIYGADEADNRKYYLKEINAEEGHFIVDEMDGIQLDCFVKGNKLISGFDVQGSFLSITEEMTSEGIFYEVIVYDSKNFTYTSQTPSDSITTVNIEDLIKCYKNVSYQKANLKKI